MGKLRLQLLGAFRLQSASGESMLLPTKKSKALLAYLALAAEQLHSRSSIASLFWDEAGERQARESLRQTLSLLRKTLLPSHGQPITSEGDAIALDPSVFHVDALEFAQLSGASDPDARRTRRIFIAASCLRGSICRPPNSTAGYRRPARDSTKGPSTCSANRWLVISPPAIWSGRPRSPRGSSPWILCAKAAIAR